MILCAVERKVRKQIFSKIPTRTDIVHENDIGIKVNVADLRILEEHKFRTLIESKDLEGLLQHYQLEKVE